MIQSNANKLGSIVSDIYGIDNFPYKLKAKINPHCSKQVPLN